MIGAPLSIRSRASARVSQTLVWQDASPHSQKNGSAPEVSWRTTARIFWFQARARAAAGRTTRGLGGLYSRAADTLLSSDQDLHRRGHGATLAE